MPIKNRVVVLFVWGTTEGSTGSGSTVSLDKGLTPLVIVSVISPVWTAPLYYSGLRLHEKFVFVSPLPAGESGKVRGKTEGNRLLIQAKSAVESSELRVPLQLVNKENPEEPGSTSFQFSLITRG